MQIFRLRSNFYGHFYGPQSLVFYVEHDQIDYLGLS